MFKTLPPFRRPPFIANAWWLAGGISPGNVVAAYSPRGAANLAASYTNLNNPGTNDAFLGVAPTFDTDYGWFFNGTTQYLRTGILQPSGQTYTMLVGFSNGSGSGLRYLVGVKKAAEQTFSISPYWTDNKIYYGHKGELGVTGGQTSGVAGFAGATAYLNGVSQGTIGVGTGTISANDLVLGARRATVVEYFFSGCIEWVAVYNSTLTLAQVQAVTAYAANQIKYTVLDEFTSSNLEFIQGVAYDGTYLYTTNLPAVPGKLKKWQKITGVWTEILSRTLTDATDNVQHISDVFFMGGSVYIADIYPFTSPTDFTGCYPRVVKFNAANLLFESVFISDPTRTNRVMEGVTYFNGAWWTVVDSHFVSVIMKYDDAGVFVKEYTIPNGDTSTEFYGYQGIEFWTEGSDIFCGVAIHDHRPNMALVILQYNAGSDTFTEVARRTLWVFANQGLMRSPSTTDATSIWFADRSSTSIGRVANVDISQWRL